MQEFNIRVSVDVTVEAEDEEEAIRLAEEQVADGEFGTSDMESEVVD